MNISVNSVMGLLRGIMKQKGAGDFLYTNDFSFIIDVIYREIQDLINLNNSEELIIEYCFTLKSMITSPLYKEYDKIALDKLKKLMKSVFTTKTVSIKSRAEAKQVYEELQNL